MHGRKFPFFSKIPQRNPIYKRQNLDFSDSEVEVYLRVASDIGISRSEFLYDVSDMIEGKSNESFDVVVANGHNWKSPDNWKIKTYPRMIEVVSLLKSNGLSCCSVGCAKEYIEGTEDRTGLSLSGSVGLIQNSQCFLSNDTGLFHVACALKKPVAVFWGFTSKVKNLSLPFHASAAIIENAMSCKKECQKDGLWKSCTDPKCREVSPKDIVEKVLSICHS